MYFTTGAWIVAVRINTGASRVTEPANGGKMLRSEPKNEKMKNTDLEDETIQIAKKYTDKRDPNQTDLFDVVNVRKTVC